MSHETAAQRARRHKRDKLRDQVLAPSYTVAPIRCGTCNHSDIMHRTLGKWHPCQSYGCGCTEYEEVDDATA